MYFGKQTCPWKHSSTCSFYYHFQNIDLLDPGESNTKFREVSHMIERHAVAILSGHEENNGIWVS